MIIAAAREIRDRELVFVGMRLPITAYGVARLTHAPDAVGLFEGGVARCHATTRKGKPCQRTPLPERDYCPSHQHLERSKIAA